MKVKLLQGLMGKGNRPSGSIQEFTKEEAEKLIDAGIAEPINSDDEDEPVVKKRSRRRRKATVEAKETR